MPLNPLSARLRNISKQPAKVRIVVAPGDELEVSGDVALQLADEARSAFKLSAEDRAKFEKERDDARAAANAPPPPADEDESAPKPSKKAQPVKKAAKARAEAKD